MARSAGATSPADRCLMPDETYTGQLAQQVSSLTFNDLPADVVTVAKQCVLDTIGVAIAGAEEPSAKILRSTLVGDCETSREVATIVGTGRSANAINAALINGTAGHALDFDDVSGWITAHPSVPILPAIFAHSEEYGLSGSSALTAFIAGFETEVRVGIGLGTHHYRSGFHTTATVGTIGAAASAASLMQLDTERTATAMGIATTQASGLRSMFGSDCKPFHAGKAASSGLLSARLAANGYTTAHDAIVCPQGFADTHTTDFDRTGSTSDFGEPWYILDSLFKFHAACYLTHAAIESARKLYPTINGDLDLIESIEISVPPGHLSVCAIPLPQTGLQGKFSLAFTSLLALSTNRCDVDQFVDTSVTSPRFVANLSRVNVIADNDLAPFAATITLRLNDGRTLTASANTGERAWSISPGEQQGRLEQKFRSLVEPILGARRAAQIIAAVATLDQAPSISELIRLTTTPRGALTATDPSRNDALTAQSESSNN